MIDVGAKLDPQIVRNFRRKRIRNGSHHARRRERRSDPACDRPTGVDGIRHSSLDRRIANRVGRGGRARGFRSARRGSARRRARSRAHHPSLQTGQPRVSPAGNRDRTAWRSEDRRARSHRGRGALLGGNARTDQPDRGSRRQSRSQNSSRRRVQAAQLALQLSGTRRKRLEMAARGGRPERPAGLQRGHGRLANPDDAALHRYFPGGRAQHAELFSAARAGRREESPCCSSAASPPRSRNFC